MKILFSAFNFLSKLKTNNITPCKEIFQNYKCKSTSFQRTRFLFTVSTHRCITVNYYTSQVNISGQNSGKYFQEIENEYAHKVMEDFPHYSDSLVVHPLKNKNIDVKGECSIELRAIERFIEVTIDNLSQGSHLGNEIYTDLVQDLCSILHEASDDEIERVLHFLCMWPPVPSTMTANFNVLWNALDKECVKRSKQWDVNQQLVIADYWFHLRLSRISKYNQEVINNLVGDIEHLSNRQVVQLMFYINLQRKIPSLFVSSLEKKLLTVINYLTLEEIGIICLGFFKTKNKILDSNLTRIILKKFMYNVEEVNTISVASILKFLRKSLDRSLLDLYILTLHKCVGYVNKWDIPTSVHSALLSSECNVYHPLLLNTVSEKLTNEITNARIKDCSKLLLSLSLFNHNEGKFHKVFLSELLKEERQDEFNRYPSHVVHAAIYYAYMGYYNYELLAKLFSKQFFKETCFRKPEVWPVFAELDCCVEIECQDYKGPKLDLSVRKVLKEYRGNFPTKSEKKPNMQTRILWDVYESLAEILGSEKNILIRHILPHMYSPDIIVNLSKSDKSLHKNYSNFPSDQILKPPSNEAWASFVTAGMYSFAYKSNQMTGITAMKLRQLKKIGYEVIFIPYYNVSQDKSRRKKFLEDKLNEIESKIEKQQTAS